MPIETKGLCAACGSHHRSDFPHDLNRKEYRERFAAKYGRDPTWEDAVAHCTPEMQAEWRDGFEVLGRPWSEPPEGQRAIVEHPDSFVGKPKGQGNRRPFRVQDDQGAGDHHLGRPPASERPDAPRGHARPPR